MKLPMTATMPSPQAEQRVRLVLEAEVWKDIEGGPDTFCVTTEDMACEPVSPARFLGMVSDARAQLDRMERLAREFEARDTLAAILAEHHARLEEWDTDVADPLLRARFAAAAYVENGQLVVVVPLGQDPVQRVSAVANAVNDAIEQAARA